MKELVQLLKDEYVRLENKESLTSAYSYHTTSVESSERTYSLVERSSKDSTSNEGNSYSRNYEEEEESSI